MNKEIEWFCYHIAEAGLLSPGKCRAVAEAISESDMEPDLQVFAQTIVDNELCSDIDRLQEFLEMAIQEARSMGFPPRSVLEDSPSPEGSAPEAPAPPSPAVPAAPPPPPPIVSSKGGPDWLQGWPSLAAAADASPDQAVALLTAFLNKARAANCSDIHISAGAVPFVRRHKQVHLVPGQDIIGRQASEKLNLTILSEEQRKTFEKTHDLDYSYSMSETDRYRTNVMLQRLGVSGSYRVIDNEIRSLEALGFPRPEVVEKLTTHHQGLILVTGPAGCGKSTTLASLVDYINRNRRDHIISVEDPIEVIHHPIGCNITQRELNRHTRSFSNALRAALREDPDIIVIGELRDLETIEMAISSSETGHLVIGTLHTGSAASTMDRVLDVFPPNQQAQIRTMVAESLKGVICQQLLPNIDGTGVVMASEIMLGTLAVSNLIRDGKTYQLDSIIQTGRNIGMSTMEQSHADLCIKGLRSYEQTVPLVKSSDLLKQMQMAEAKRGAEAAGGKKKKRKWF